MRLVCKIISVLLVCILIFPGVAHAQQEEQVAEIAFAGDIMALSSQLSSARVKGGYNFDHVFKYVAPIFKKADIAIGNLETQVAGKQFKTTDKKKYDGGYPYINAPDSFLKAVSQAGFDVLSTANNHTLV